MGCTKSRGWTQKDGKGFIKDNFTVHSTKEEGKAAFMRSWLGDRGAEDHWLLWLDWWRMGRSQVIVDKVERKDQTNK